MTGPGDDDPIPAPDEKVLPPRYAPGRALPPYRYVPGLYPHPNADPAGHSYGHEEPEVDFLLPEAWGQNMEYRFGADLFNRRYYWEAHESWERVWHTCDKARTQGLFIQGLIQLSAALLKWHMGSEYGTRKLYDAAREKLEPARREFPRGYMGLEMERWMGEVERCFEYLLVHESARGAAPELPVIRLQDPGSGSGAR